MGKRIAVLVLLVAGCGGSGWVRSKHASYVPTGVDEDDVADDADAAEHAAPPPDRVPRPVDEDESDDEEEEARELHDRGRSGGCTRGAVACMLGGHEVCSTDADGCRVCTCAQPRGAPDEWSNATRPAWP